MYKHLKLTAKLHRIYQFYKDINTLINKTRILNSVYN